MAQALAGAGIILAFLTSYCTATSAQNAWSIIHFLQLVLILPFIAKEMSVNLQAFIAFNAFAALSADSLFSVIGKYLPLMKNLSYGQPHEYLKILNISSGSVVLHNSLILAMLLLYSIIRLIRIIMYLLKNEETRFSFIISKTYQYFSFSAWIKIFIERYMFTLLITLCEIAYYVEIQVEKKDRFWVNDASNHVLINVSYI